MYFTLLSSVFSCALFNGSVFVVNCSPEGRSGAAAGRTGRRTPLMTSLRSRRLRLYASRPSRCSLRSRPSHMTRLHTPDETTRHSRRHTGPSPPEPREESKTHCKTSPDILVTLISRLFVLVE